MIFDNFDANLIMKHEQIVANSAKQVADMNAEMVKNMGPVRKANEERHNAILQTAQVAIEQKKLIEDGVNVKILVHYKYTVSWKCF